MLNTTENTIRAAKKKIEDCTSEIDRLEKARKEAWDSIKDFRVSSNEADATYNRMSQMLRDSNKLKGEIKKLEKKIKKLQGE